MNTRSQPRRSLLLALGLALIVAVGLARIVSTYHVFNHTIDEGAHLACGIQWFEHHYDYDPKHTPVARIAIALLPRLDGVHGYGNASFWQEGVQELSSGGHYWRTLTLARLGVLPFFVLAVLVIFFWTRRLYGRPTAWLAAGIFSMLPVVLAHSGLATTDIALTATFLIAVWALTHWMTNPTWRSAAAFGAATGLAIATKLSALAFLPAIMVCVLPVYVAAQRSERSAACPPTTRWRCRALAGQVLLGALCAVLIIWAAYRFTHAPISQVTSAPDRWADRVFGATSGTAHALHALTATLPLPAPDLFAGLRDFRDINRPGVRSYLLGQVRQGGWWYFYTVALAVKTPLAVLLLALVGTVTLVYSWLRVHVDWQRLVPALGVVAILVVVAPTRLDIGVRHVMPVFAFLSMLAGAGAVALWGASSDRGMAARRTATVALLVWLAVSSARAHPDYLAYFNEAAGNHPADVLVISDLDWGQDFTRLASYLKAQRVAHLSMASDNFLDPVALGLPDTVRLHCGESATGWIAVEERRVRVYPECYRWLAGRPLQSYVGKSMRVYFIPTVGSPDPQAPGLQILKPAR